MLKAEKIPLSYYVLVLAYMRKGSIGRYTLAEYLGTTRAKVRKIFNELGDMGLVKAPGKSTGRKGTTLTEKGLLVNERIETKIKVYLDSYYTFPESYALDKEMTIVGVREQSLDVSKVTGLFERDSAIRAGATGALILANTGSQWIFPNDGSIADVHPVKKIIPHDKILIITFAPDRGSSNVSAVETALLLVNPEEIEKDIFN